MKAPDRPSSVLVVAILQICFGSLGLLGSLCGGAVQLAGGAKAFTPQPPAGANAPAQPDVEAMMRKRLPYYDALQGGQIALSIVSGTVMLVGGIGLLKMRPWARHLTIGYACYNIVITIAGFVFGLLVTGPVMKEAFAEMRADPNLPPGAGNMMGMVETIATAAAFVPLFLLVYPIILLVIMFLPTVREAFRAAALPPGKDEEYDDEEYDDEPDEEEAPPGEAPSPRREEGIQPGEE